MFTSSYEKRFHDQTTSTAIQEQCPSHSTSYLPENTDVGRSKGAPLPSNANCWTVITFNKARATRKKILVPSTKRQSQTRTAVSAGKAAVNNVGNQDPVSSARLVSFTFRAAVSLGQRLAARASRTDCSKQRPCRSYDQTHATINQTNTQCNNSCAGAGQTEDGTTLL